MPLPKEDDDSGIAFRMADRRRLHLTSGQPRRRSDGTGPGPTRVIHRNRSGSLRQGSTARATSRGRMARCMSLKPVKAGPASASTGPKAQSATGASGSITKLKHHRQSRVVKGLPSLANEGTGENAIGPADVQMKGRRYTVALGLGAEPDLRAQFRASAKSSARYRPAGSAARAFRCGRHCRVEDAVNPDGTERDSNPTALLQRGGARTSSMPGATRC